MGDDEGQQSETSLLGELLEMGHAIRPLLRRLPTAMKAIDKLTGGLTSAGVKALAARLNRYRTGNLIQEAQQVADATGLPLPEVFDRLVRQRRIDELTVEALRRVSESAEAQSEAENADTAGAERQSTTDRWFHTLYAEAGAVDEEDVREAFVRILAGEMQAPGSFSLRSLRVMGAVSRSTAQRFRRAASVSIRLTPDGTHIMDARIPAIGGELGQNCLQSEGLSYDVLTDLTENGFIHSDYGSYHPYGPLELPFDAPQSVPPFVQIPFTHQGTTWVLIPKEKPNKVQPFNVQGAKLTSCGVELLKIVDIESLPSFTEKLVGHFSQSGYQMVRST
ncbi:MAG: DUF2806 domain-containing protein [Gammaproteobacteria bacterium]|nr:DUF2806 domain-containing protein [Gammaproteobacteria bacterium]